jgi:hypothetical protein
MAPRKQKQDPETQVETQVEPKPETRPKLVSSIYMVNPYTRVVYYPGEVVEDVKVDSWTECQIAVGLLKEV